MPSKREEQTKPVLKIVEDTDFNLVAATPEGKKVFKQLMEICGFKKPSVVLDPSTGEVNSQSTVYNEARRNLYLQIRALIRPEYLNEIEAETIVYEKV